VLQKCWNKKHIHRLEEVEAEEEAAGEEEIPENAQVKKHASAPCQMHISGACNMGKKQDINGLQKYQAGMPI